MYSIILLFQAITYQVCNIQHDMLPQDDSPGRHSLPRSNTTPGSGACWGAHLEAVGALSRCPPASPPPSTSSAACCPYAALQIFHCPTKGCCMPRRAKPVPGWMQWPTAGNRQCQAYSQSHRAFESHLLDCLLPSVQALEGCPPPDI